MAVSRRSLLKGISLTSVMSTLSSRVKAAPKRSPGPYEQLGIRPGVNFQGTMTTLGASKMWEDLHEAAAQASREYVVLEELKEKIGKRLSALIGCEDAMVTPGAAAAICWEPARR
jgi:Selenocysteine synthase [seryl-tRNASer selenium transferase]